MNFVVIYFYTRETNIRYSYCLAGQSNFSLIVALRGAAFLHTNR